MYPYLRTLGILLSARPTPGRAPEQPSVFRTVCWPWDADMFLELNNGRHLTLFDLGRLDYGARLGLFRALRRNGWGLVVGGVQVQYRRRIRVFQRFEIVTRLLARDAKWFYFEQTTVRRGTPCSSALLRVAVVDGPKGTVPTQRVAEALGWPDWHGALPAWAAQLAEADSARPWPPEAAAPAASRTRVQPASET
ncbi:MAG: thioesterase family protein [Pseudomonadota bacterium]